MPRKVSAQHREAILDAALECFSKRGFDATRVEDIWGGARNPDLLSW